MKLAILRTWKASSARRRRAGKPVVVAEFGWYGGGSLNPWAGASILPPARRPKRSWCRKAVETATGLATGWLNWGFYDHPEAGNVSQRTGLLAVDGRPKAWAREFQRLAGTLARARATGTAQLSTGPTLDWDRCLTDPGEGREFLQQYGKAFQSQHGPR